MGHLPWRQGNPLPREDQIGVGTDDLAIEGVHLSRANNRHREEKQMDEETRRERELDVLEVIAAELEALRVLKEHELGVRLEYDPDDDGPYVPEAEK
jgi:hypothetical protein